MKKILILVLSAAFFFSGCANRQAEKAETVPSIKIGVLLYNRDDTFISHLFADFEKEVKAMELREQIKITVAMVDGKGNQSVQNDQIDRFIEQGVDVLCVNIVDRTAAATVIDKAKSANIPIVFFNREPVAEDLERWERIYYVGTTPSANGKIQGEIVAEAYQKDPAALDKDGDGKLQYVMLEGEQGHQDSLLRTEYCIKSIAGFGIQVEKLANDTANWQRAQASAKMGQWLKTLGGAVELVLCNNDEMALGAIDAYQAAGYESLPFIVGVDGTEDAIAAMSDGTLSGTVLNDSPGQAKAMMNLCYALAGYAKVEDTVSLVDGKYVRTPCRKITPENLENFERVPVLEE